MGSAVPSLLRAVYKASDGASSDVCWTSPLTSNGRPDVDVQEGLCAGVCAPFCGFWPPSAAGEATGRGMTAGRIAGSSITPGRGAGCAVPPGCRSVGRTGGEEGTKGGLRESLIARRLCKAGWEVRWVIACAAYVRYGEAHPHLDAAVAAAVPRGPGVAPAPGRGLRARSPSAPGTWSRRSGR